MHVHICVYMNVYVCMCTYVCDYAKLGHAFKLVDVDICVGDIEASGTLIGKTSAFTGRYERKRSSMLATY